MDIESVENENHNANHWANTWICVVEGINEYEKFGESVGCVKECSNEKSYLDEVILRVINELKEKLEEYLSWYSWKLRLCEDELEMLGFFITTQSHPLVMAFPFK